MEFSTLAMRKIIKSQTEKRISDSAAEELGEILEVFAGDLAEEAIAIADEDGRKTVRAEDIKGALE